MTPNAFLHGNGGFWGRRPCLALALVILAIIALLPLLGALGQARAADADERLSAMSSAWRMDAPVRGERRVRHSVALNVNTPPDILEWFADSAAEEIRALVALNSGTPRKTLEKLADDEDSAVRVVAARNPSTPPEIREKLSNNQGSASRPPKGDRR